MEVKMDAERILRAVRLRLDVCRGMIALGEREADAFTRGAMHAYAAILIEAGELAECPCPPCVRVPLKPAS